MVENGFGLDGAVAAVTGAGAGLGRAEALGLAAAGARLVLNDVSEEAAQAVAAEVASAGGEAVVCSGDISEMTVAAALLAASVHAYGRLDVVVNNAGVLRDRMVFSMSTDEWDLVMRVHLRGHFVTTRVATAYWRERSKQAGGPVFARIINTSSEAFLLGPPGQPNYAAAKAGIVALTASTARGCGRYGVRANAICPRARTAMTAGLMGPAPDGADPLAPEHVAPLVTYLAGPAGQRINGEVFVVHGGVVALLAPPTVRASFRADEGRSWSPATLNTVLCELFPDDEPQPGFVTEETLPLAEQ